MANGSVKRKGKVWSFVVDLAPMRRPAGVARLVGRGFATKKAAEAALRDLASAADAGTAVSRSRITVSQFLTDRLEAERTQGSDRRFDSAWGATIGGGSTSRPSLSASSRSPAIAAPSSLDTGRVGSDPGSHP